MYGISTYIYHKKNIKSQLNGDTYLGGDFKHFLFSPLPGEMIQFD